MTGENIRYLNLEDFYEFHYLPLLRVEGLKISELYDLIEYVEDVSGRNDSTVDVEAKVHSMFSDVVEYDDNRIEPTGSALVLGAVWFLKKHGALGEFIGKYEPDYLSELGVAPDELNSIPNYHVFPVVHRIFMQVFGGLSGINNFVEEISSITGTDFDVEYLTETIVDMITPNDVAFEPDIFNEYVASKSGCLSFRVYDDYSNFIELIIPLYGRESLDLYQVLVSGTVAPDSTLIGYPEKFIEVFGRDVYNEAMRTLLNFGE